MRTKKTRSKKSKRRSRFGGMGGTNSTREDLYNRSGHYLGVVTGVESAHRATDDAPFIAIRAGVIKAYDDGERFVPPGASEPIPHHVPGDSPGNVLMEGRFGFLENWKNFMQVAGDISDAEVEELAGQLYEAAQSDEDLPEELEQYADFVDEIKEFDDALDVVWEVASEEAYGDDKPLNGVIVEWVSNMRLKKDSRKKPESQLTLADDYYTRTVYRRRLSYTEALAEVGDDDTALRRILPDIDDRVAAEAEEEGED